MRAALIPQSSNWQQGAFYTPLDPSKHRIVRLTIQGGDELPQKHKNASKGYLSKVLVSKCLEHGSTYSFDIELILCHILPRHGLYQSVYRLNQTTKS